MEYLFYRAFANSLRDLKRKGGLYQRAGEQVEAILGRINVGEDPFHGVGVTNHGETRIRHSVKYDLQGRSRLVTWKSDRICLFLYCGTHDDVDRWLDRNRGLVPVIDDDLRVTATFATNSDEIEARIEQTAGIALGKLYERLPEDLYERVATQLSRKVCRSIEECESTVTDQDLWTALAEVEEPSLRHALFDVMVLLRGDKVAEAKSRVRLFLGDDRPLEFLHPDELPTLVDSDVIRRIPPSSPVYTEAIRRFTNSARYRDWMLFMQRDQEAVVLEDFNGPAKLVGVSGSGKTCVVVQRAVRLARENPSGRVLVLTINRPLANLIALLIDTVATDEERSRIDAKPFSQVCRELLRTFLPKHDRHFDEITWRTHEHIDEIWQEYYRCENNNDDAAILHSLHDTLLARGWNAERYLREEFDWIRSALRLDERQEYMRMERKGRSVNFLSQHREDALKGLAGWEDKMSQVGAVDGLGVAHALLPFASKIEPLYNAVLVDEAQDFGNVELEIVRRLVSPGSNDIFLCGDAAQAVTTKFQSLKRVGIDVPGARSRRLSLNYRNSRDILSAAYAILESNLTEEMIDREDFDILHPDYSTHSGPTPLCLEADSLEREIAHALAFVQSLLAGKVEGKGCIAVCGYSLLELTRFGERVDLPVLDGQTNIEEGAIFVSDLEQTKGFEFDVVCIVNCSRGVLPSGSAPESEQYRDLARLYVAMTRAKRDLVISWSGERSPFLKDADSVFATDLWFNHVEVEPVVSVGVPDRLEAHRQFGMHRKKWWAMSGAQFLHTEWALGLSPELIARVRKLVDGRGLIRNRQRVRFKTMGVAAEEFHSSPTQRLRWGPSISSEFGALIQRLESTSPRRQTGEFPVVR